MALIVVAESPRTSRYTPAVMGQAQRHFLEWDRPLLDSVTDWLAAELGPDCSACVVALPGRRAGRRLLQALALRHGHCWTPPTVVTVGTLVDHCVLLTRPIASRSARTCAWRQALEAEGLELRPLATRLPAPGDHSGWARLAAAVRRLHGELGGEGLEFADVLADPEVAVHESERRRWQALVSVQERYSQRLSAVGLADPHDARRAALAAGRLVTHRRVVLIGAAELPGLTRSLIACLEGRVDVLIAAPPELADTFDEYGAVVTEAWRARSVPVDLERWRVAEDPTNAATSVARWLSERSAGHALTDVTIGLADPDLAPVISRCFETHDVPAHDPSGTPLSATASVRLLLAACEYLEGEGWEPFAGLLRHADMEDALARELGDDARDPAGILDLYHVHHLPATARGDVQRDRGTAKIAPELERLLGACRELLGDLARGGEAPLSECRARCRPCTRCAFRPETT